MKYLHLSYLRILRAKTSSGQEAAVRLLADPDHPLQFWQDHSLRDNLLHAIQGFAIAKNEPDKVIEFNLGYPAKSMVNLPGASSHVHVFESPTSVAAVCCDGNFGVHRALLSGVDPPRSVRLKGKPRKLIGDLHAHAPASRRTLYVRCYPIGLLVGNLSWTLSLNVFLGLANIS